MRAAKSVSACMVAMAVSRYSSTISNEPIVNQSLVDCLNLTFASATPRTSASTAAAIVRLAVEL